jgi:hypothetical protein
VADGHEIEHDDPLEIREDVTLAPDADVPEEIEERLSGERGCGHDGWVAGCPDCEREAALADELLERQEKA